MSEILVMLTSSVVSCDTTGSHPSHMDCALGTEWVNLYEPAETDLALGEKSFHLKLSGDRKSKDWTAEGITASCEPQNVHRSGQVQMHTHTNTHMHAKKKKKSW